MVLLQLSRLRTIQNSLWSETVKVFIPVGGTRICGWFKPQLQAMQPKVRENEGHQASNVFVQLWNNAMMLRTSYSADAVYLQNKYIQTINLPYKTSFLVKSKWIILIIIWDYADKYNQGNFGYMWLWRQMQSMWLWWHTIKVILAIYD